MTPDQAQGQGAQGVYQASSTGTVDPRVGGGFPRNDPGSNGSTDQYGGWYDSNGVFHPYTHGDGSDGTGTGTEHSNGPDDPGGGIAPTAEVFGRTGAGTDKYGQLGGLGGFEANAGKYSYGGIVGPQVSAGHMSNGQKIPAYYAGPFSRWGEGGASGNAQLAEGRAFAGYASTMDNPDIDPVTRANMLQESQEAGNAKYAGAFGQMKRNAAITNNSSGLNAGLAQLSASEAGDQGKAIRDVELANDAERQRRYQWGVQGVQGMGDQQQAYLGNLFGMRSGLSNQPLVKNSRTQGTGNVVGGSLNMGLNLGG